MKSAKSVFVFICIAAVSVVTQTPAAAQFGQKMRKALEGLKPKEGGEATVSGPKALDQNGLRKILPQWDPRKDTSQQFPHVAVTVLKSPAMWGEPAYTDQLKEIPVPGCFTLQLRVWSDESNSKVVGPFDWCAPRDLEVGPGMLGSSRVVSAGLKGGRMLTATQKDYHTGLTRTEGPRPPDTLVPDDPETQAYAAKNNREGSVRNLSMDNNSRFGIMFFNLRAGMGQMLDTSDHRVWIVEIRDPSRLAPLVEPGTLSPSLEAPTTTHGGAQLPAPAPVNVAQGDLVDSHVPCPANPKSMEFLKRSGYQCVNGSLWVPKPAGFDALTAGTPPPGGGAISVGDVVVPKIAGLKLLAEPKDEARVVRVLTKSDEFVVTAADNNGFLTVENASGKGWLKTVMVTKK